MTEGIQLKSTFSKAPRYYTVNVTADGDTYVNTSHVKERPTEKQAREAAADNAECGRITIVLKAIAVYEPVSGYSVIEVDGQE